MAYDPCNPVPDNTIPAGYTPHHHHAVHHVVGRVKHAVHHKFVHLGPPSAAPTPYGCEKHAIAGPGYGHGAPLSPAAPLSKAAALGGVGAGLVALGGVGGLVGGFIPGIPSVPTGCTRSVLVSGKPVTVACTTTPGNPTTPTTPVTPTTPTTPTTPVVPPVPPTTVPEPSAIAVFVVGATLALLAHRVNQRRLARLDRAAQ